MENYESLTISELNSQISVTENTLHAARGQGLGNVVDEVLESETRRLEILLELQQIRARQKLLAEEADNALESGAFLAAKKQAHLQYVKSGRDAETIETVAAQGI